jgi:DNA invertase Pin-like site-specific DNA recombinase
LHTDITFWHNFDNEKYEINLYTDQRIDVEEKFTVQESTIKNPYFDYTSRKKIAKNTNVKRVTMYRLINLILKNTLLR